MSEEQISWLAPMSGELCDLGEVPDEVFRDKLMGPGFAIVPSGNILFSPAKAVVLKLVKTGHAVIIRVLPDLEVLLHLGINSVSTEGVFKVLVQENQTVLPGQPLVEFDLQKLRSTPGVKSISPIVFLNLPTNQTLELARSKRTVQALESLALQLKTC